MAARKVPLNEQTLMTLIDEVKKRRCLWDLDDQHYNDRYRLAVAWEQISAEMNLPEDGLRAKWKNLRDLFKREEKKSTYQTVDDYVGKWRYFKPLWFLHRAETVDAASEEDSVETDISIVKDENYSQNLYEVLIENGVRKRFSSDSDAEQDEKKLKLSDDCHDYDTMFLKSLTPFLRELEPWRKLMVRNKIQEIILNELAAQNNFILPH